MKLLITGINGFLGRHLTNHLSSKGFKVIATGRKSVIHTGTDKFIYLKLDLLDTEQLFELSKETKPDIIIHTAAISKPDECEANQELCIRTNFDATKNLATAAKELQAKLIFISTDFVLGEGENQMETATPNPLNFYGQSKLMAETYIHKHLENYAIIRPVFIYGKHIEGIRNTFLDWIKESLETKTKIKVVNDQFRTPTYVEDICFGIEQIIRQNKIGIYHLAGEQILTPYSMAVKIAHYLNFDANLIEPVNENDFIEKVKRAKKNILSIDKAKKEINFKPLCFDDGLIKSFSQKNL